MAKREIDVELLDAEVNGVHGWVQVPIVPPWADGELAAALSVLRAAQLAGHCQCGARRVLPPRHQRRKATRSGVPTTVLTAHRPSCPARPEVLADLFASAGVRGFRTDADGASAADSQVQPSDGAR